MQASLMMKLKEDPLQNIFLYYQIIQYHGNQLL